MQKSTSDILKTASDFSPNTTEKADEQGTDSLELKLSKSLQDLMEDVSHQPKIPKNQESKTTYLLTTSLMALVVRQNLGTTFEELKVALNEARKEHEKLKTELVALEAIPNKDNQDRQIIETQKVEIGVLQETILVLETALVKAEKDHNDMLNMSSNLNMTRSEVMRIQRDLQGLNKRLSTVPKSLDEVSITISDSQTAHDKAINSIYNVPNGRLIRWLISIFVFFIILLLLVLVWAWNCSLIKKI